MMKPDTAKPGAAANGADWRRMLATASTWMERNAAAVDAINVFPVPDGDTGSNLALTVRAAAAAVALPDGLRAPPDGAGAVLAAAAHGALLGARGNSGVIWSQWLRGLAESLVNEDISDGRALRAALARASEAAYAALSDPREGTILSVALALSEGVEEPNAAAALRSAITRGEEALTRTPDQMPLLRQAGVVDAGGRGLLVVLEGLLYGLTQEALPDLVQDSGRIRPAWLEGTHAQDDFGYCTEFVVTVVRGEASGLRRQLEALGTSVLVVGDATALHVHVHLADPDAAFAAGARYGRVERRKAEDMAVQRDALVHSVGVVTQDTGGTPGRDGAMGLVAVADGRGFARLFTAIGATHILDGGGGRNPSAADILNAARATGAADVIVLTNHENIVPAARQAAGLSEHPRMHVVASTSMPAGVAALLAGEAARTVDEAVGEVTARMSAAAAAALCGAVTRAARAVPAPMALRKAQPFALVDGEVVAGAESLEEALCEVVRRLRAARPSGELLTVYWGAEIDEGEAARVVESLDNSAQLGSCEVEVVDGGQAHYPYLVSLE